APKVGTFHRSGGSAAYDVLGPLVRYAGRRLDVRCAVSEDALATARTALGGDYQLVFNGIELERFAKAVPWPADAPTILFVGRHRPPRVPAGGAARRRRPAGRAGRSHRAGGRVAAGVGGRRAGPRLDRLGRGASRRVLHGPVG